MKAVTRLRGLDGLRGVAALAVFGVHYNQIVDVDVQAGPFDIYLLLVNGQYGVALFFILSGFLLSQPFWKSTLYDASWPATRTYIIRRLVRILPAYYLALTVLILLAGYWQHPQAWADILLHYSFLFNYTEFSIFSINSPFWTLAVEVQFYCLLPFLFVLLRRFSLRHSVAVLIVFSLLAYAMHYWLVSTVDKIILWPGSTVLAWVRPYGAVVTHSLLAHLPHFFTGVICGGCWLHLTRQYPKMTTEGDWRCDFLFWVALGLILILLSTETGENIQVPYGRYGLPIIPLLIGMLVFCAPLTRSAAKLLDSAPFRITGVLSYGLYIYHLPIMRYVDQRMAEMNIDARDHGFSLAVITLVVTLLVAGISYVAVERPLIKRVNRKH